MTLQDRITSIQPYFRGIEIKETLFIVRILYPKKWTAYNREDEVIKVTKSDTNSNEWFYYANIDEIDLNEIFDLVEDTIHTNEALYMKIELMKKKMEELKNLFQEETLERLRTLEFTFTAKPKRKRKKQIQSITIQEAQEEQEQAEHDAVPQEVDHLQQEDLLQLEEGWK